MQEQLMSPVEDSSVLSVSDEDLRQYVAGRLDGERRAAIEGFLACNPDLAAKVMRSLHQSKRMHPVARGAGTATGNAQRTRIAAALACAVMGWALAESMDDDGPFRDLSSTPEYVDDAIMSQRVSHMRFDMHSQVETLTLDPVEIQRATRIRVPPLPGDWRLLDAQIYPSKEGPSVNVLIETPQGRKLSLFAVRADRTVDDRPVVTTEKGEHAAYWESNGDAYVLTGSGSVEDLLAGAHLLARRATP